jgi:Fe-S-cluster containining protein
MSDAENSEAGTAEPWYKDGLQFTCTQCGNCCTGSPGVVWVDDDEIRAIADHLDKPVGEIRLMHTRSVRGKVSLTEFANGNCTFFDPHGRGCTVYPARPKQCRTWPFWNSNLSSEQAWNSIKPECPGAGHGDFVSLEDIEIRRSVIDM